MRSFSDWNVKRSRRLCVNGADSNTDSASDNRQKQGATIQLSKLIPASANGYCVHQEQQPQPLPPTPPFQTEKPSELLTMFDRICHKTELDDLYWWSSLITTTATTTDTTTILEIQSIKRIDDFLLIKSCGKSVFYLNPHWLWNQVHHLHRPLRRIIPHNNRMMENPSSLEDLINLIIKEILLQKRILPIIEHQNIIRRFQVVPT